MIQMKVLTPDPDGRDLAAEATTDDGRLKVMPASFYAGTTMQERTILAHKMGAYCLPTTELIDWLRERIAGRSVIEIGAGNGVIADALGIPGTDNLMQTWPDIAAYYKAMGQPVVQYGPNVERLTAAEAMAAYRPQVVIGAWVTHVYDENRHAAGGNVWGVDEQAILDTCEEYIFIGNTKVHEGKAIWGRAHTKHQFPWLYSRAFNGTPDFITVWTGKANAIG